MSQNLDSLTSLTEFGPPSPETKEPTVSSLFFKFFNFSRGELEGDPKPQTLSPTNSVPSNFPVRSESSPKLTDKTKNDLDDTVSLPDPFRTGAGEGRSLQNVLKSVRHLLALRNTGLQDYKDTDLQQYWMPDSKSKECYDCSSKFTFIIRRHHCRVCGQIFCYRCCNQEIPGKIMNCTGDLRVCTYCCKVVLSYLQSADVDADLSADLRALQEDLQSKFGSSDLSSNVTMSGSQSNLSISHKLSSCSMETEDSVKRKTSVGYQEERFAQGRSSYFGIGSSPSIEEKFCKSIKNSSSMQSLIEEMKHPTQGLSVQTFKHQTWICYSCFLGTQLVDWLIGHNKAVNRSQATVVGQALLEANLLECASAEADFIDGPALYRFCSTPIRLESSDASTFGQSEKFSFTESEFLNYDNLYSILNIDKSSDTKPFSSDSTTSPDTKVASPGVGNTGDCKLYDNRVSESKESLTTTSLKNLISVYQERELHIRPINWNAVNPQALRSDFQEAKIFNDLRNAFSQHRQRFLSQLLASAGLPLSWIDIVIPLVDRVVDDVKPDLSENVDIMDIRQYVQVKKVAGGSRQDSFLVGGVVFTKNIVHRGMANRLVNPRILLIQCPIVYHRIEGKLLSLEPVMLQEEEYLNRVVSRIASLKPDIVLVHRNVSRLAQESLHDLKITLILNVKLSVLERIARCTKADIITSVDAFFGKQHLGTCHYFHVETFESDFGISKTLVFFEGCAFPHRGSTVILRSNSYQELSKLKAIMNQMIFMTYNWRLEYSFLMDEFARPPNLVVDNFFKDPTCRKKEKQETIDTNDNNVEKARFSIGEEEVKKLDKEIKEVKEVVKEESKKDESGSDVVNEISALRTIMKLENEDSSKQFVNDFSDPLHIYLNSDNQSFSSMCRNVSNQTLSIAEVPQTNSFRKILDDTILCVSPFITFSIPYLETEAGKHCELRKYFPPEIYYSALFQNETTSRNSHNYGKQVNSALKAAQLGDVHSFLIAKLTSSATDDEVKKLLALFRACGGRLKNKKSNFLLPNKNGVRKETINKESNENDGKKKVDALDPMNHQRLAVLFCSFSPKSNNAPAFCLTPWIVNIDFYGHNDIPLGRFLEKYCFRSAYKCPSPICDTSMVEHERRFVHHNGCVQLTLEEISPQPEKPMLNERILLWSWCPICCMVTPVVPMSTDTWALSFGKYLELKFYGNMYTCRAFVEDRCKHSLHYDYCQYFAFRNRVACFRYLSIVIWEISLPPHILTVSPPLYQQDLVLDEMKEWALMGHEVFSNVLGKLCSYTVPTEATIQSLKQHLQRDQAFFKSKVEEIQVKLTSPTLEKHDVISEGNQMSVLELEDAVVNLKRMVVETVDKWNSRLLKVEVSINSKKRDEKSKKADSRNLITVHDPVVENLPSLKHDSESIASNSTVEESTLVDDSNITTQQNQMISSCELGMELDEESDELKKVETVSDSQITKAPLDSEKISDSNEGKSKVKKSSNLKQEEMTISVEGEDDLNVDCVDYDSGSGLAGESTTGMWLSEKKAVKNILMQLLPGATPDLPIQCPTNPSEHYALSSMNGSLVPVVVYENEPSSIIAHALSSQDYRLALSDLLLRKQSTETQHSPNTNSKKKSTSTEDMTPTGGKQKVFSFLRPQNSNSSIGKCSSDNVNLPFLSGSDEMEAEETIKSDVDTKSKTCNDDNSSNVEIQFSDVTASFMVKIYKAEEFHSLRSVVFPAGEAAFIRSLSRCVHWAARGGKSGSNFSKTKDDRFILKEMPRQETHLFLDFAQHYFNYIHNCYSTNQPTVLGKIVGVYRITHRNVITNTTVKTNLLVMENLFYGCSVTHKFDLKGSIRNRLVTLSGEHEEETVLLDENFINMTRNSPLYIHSHSKAVLNSAINNDTKLLASRSIMDYSLLVGLDENKKELVVGIIDFIRTFTWDKKVEAMVKKSGLLGGQGKLPTIVSPNLYRERFMTAMDRYFLLVPNRWSNLET